MTHTTEPIQPIQSHTEILIQQAYDRGYADKAMKADEQLATKLLDKCCKHNHTTIRNTAGGGNYSDCYDCGARLMPWSLVAVHRKEYERLARIDELTKLKDAHTINIFDEYVNNRIAQLNTTKEQV